MKRKKEWFHHFKGFYYALWWIKAGHRPFWTGEYPSAQEAAKQLAYLQDKGPSEKVFTFKNTYPPTV